MTKFLTGASHIAMTPIERQMGRIMRAPDHDSFTGGDNTGGGGSNNSSDGGSEGNQNNNGQKFDPASFWNEPEAENNSSPQSGGSVDGGNQSSGTQQDQVGTALASQLGALNFGEGVLTQEAMEAANNGDLKPFHTNLNKFGQDVTKQALTMSVQVMQEFGQRLLQVVESKINGQLTSRDNTAELVKDFPAAANPKVAPVIQSIFDRALRLTKGNRGEAIAMTKEMMKAVATETSGDLNLSLAPTTPGDNVQTPKTDWIAELVGR